MIEHRAMAGCNEIVPLWGVVAGGSGPASWASLLTVFATTGRESFFFASASPLGVGLPLWIRYRDEVQGMVTVDCVIGSTIDRGEWFEIHAVRCDCVENEDYAALAA